MQVITYLPLHYDTHFKLRNWPLDLMTQTLSSAYIALNKPLHRPAVTRYDSNGKRRTIVTVWPCHVTQRYDLSRYAALRLSVLQSCYVVSNVVRSCTASPVSSVPLRGRGCPSQAKRDRYLGGVDTVLKAL